MIYRSKKNHRSVRQRRSMDKPATQIIPLVKPCSSTALRSYPSAHPSRLGSVIDNHFNCGGMIFFFGVSPYTAFHIPGKAPGTYRHRLYGLPRIPLPGHTRKITFVTMMSTFKFSLRLELVVCRDFIFFGFLFRRCSLCPPKTLSPSLPKRNSPLSPSAYYSCVFIS